MASKEEFKTVQAKHYPTVETSLKLAATRILARFGDRMNPHRKAQLEQVLNDELRSSRYNDTIYAEIELGRYGINLDVKFDFFTREEQVRDTETGDLYGVFDGANVTVNWPSFGSMEPGQASAILALYAEVAAFAGQLEVELKRRTLMLWMTQAQQDESEAKRNEEIKRVALVKGIQAVNKNMRVGAERRSEFPGVPAGHHHIEIDNKKYAVYVTVINGVPGETKHVGNVYRTA